MKRNQRSPKKPQITNLTTKKATLLLLKASDSRAFKALIIT